MQNVSLMLVIRTALITFPPQPPTQSETKIGTRQSSFRRRGVQHWEQRLLGVQWCRHPGLWMSVQMEPVFTQCEQTCECAEQGCARGGRISS